VTNRYSYGSRTDLLPTFMVRDGSAARVLSAEESREAEARSLARFPATGGGISWDGMDVLEQGVYEDEPDEARLLREFLVRHVTPDSDVVIFTEVAGVPTVALPVRTAMEHLPEILDRSANLWLFATGDRIIIECLDDGTITAGRIP
jgi:hypothetical protein